MEEKDRLLKIDEVAENYSVFQNTHFTRDVRPELKTLFRSNPKGSEGRFGFPKARFNNTLRNDRHQTGGYYEYSGRMPRLPLPSKNLSIKNAASVLRIWNKQNDLED
jgi:hypothetical protein